MFFVLNESPIDDYAPLPEFMDSVDERLEALRAEQRANAERVLSKLTGLRMDYSYTGDAYVEEVGGMVHFENGTYEHMYLPAAFDLRDGFLRYAREARSDWFGKLAEQVPPGRRVLNIGAGGDVTPITSFREAGHEVVSTDYVDSAIQRLRNRVDAPGFACDLIHLDRILGEDSFDVIIGNSTLAYVELRKYREVIKNLSAVMSEGALFTFDMAPNPATIRVVIGQTERAVINEGAANPAQLLELIKKYGPEEALHLMGHLHTGNNYAAHGATLSLLKELFEEEGWQVKVCESDLKVGDSHAIAFVLRVAKEEDSPLLQPAEGEKVMNMEGDFLSQAMEGRPPSYALDCIDDYWCERLCEALGIKTDCWGLVRFVSERQDSRKADRRSLAEVLASLNLERGKARLMPFVDGAIVPELTDLPDARAFEQVVRKGVIHGSGPFGHLTTYEADRLIARKRKELERAEREKGRAGRKGGGNKKRKMQKRSKKKNRRK